MILRYAERMVTHAATFRALADLRVWFFRGLAARAAGGLGFRQAGDLLSRMVGDVEALDGLYIRILLPLAGALILIPAATIFAARIEPAAGAAVFVLFTAAAFLMPLLAARAARQAGFRLTLASAGLRIAALDTLSGLREVDGAPEEAARSLGAAPVRAFLRTTLHAIRPSIITAAFFAFLASFDDVVIALFISGTANATLPKKIWESVRLEIDPTVAAVSCLLVVLSLLLLTLAGVRRRA